MAWLPPPIDELQVCSEAAAASATATAAAASARAAPEEPLRDHVSSVLLIKMALFLPRAP